MKLNELMIDDWVLDKKTNRPYKIIGTNDLLFHNDYSPIPLTSEILEKNGFEKTLDADDIECYRYYNRAADGHIKIILHDGGDGDWSIEILNYDKFNDYEIRYKNEFLFLNVHLLQHALRLCNINKEIEL